MTTTVFRRADQPESGTPWLAATFVLALTVQIGVGIWFASSVGARLDAVQQAIAANGGIEHRISTMETKLDLLLTRDGARR